MISLYVTHCSGFTMKGTESWDWLVPEDPAQSNLRQENCREFKSNPGDPAAPGHLELQSEALFQQQQQQKNKDKKWNFSCK